MSLDMNVSDISKPFADKILDDKDFDTIFGASEDDELMEAVLGGDDFSDDERDFGGIEDGTGAIGKGTGHGADLGPGHDSKGADAPKDDTSDEDLIDKLDSYKQDSVIDAYKADPTQKAADIDPQSIEDSTEKLKKTDTFEDAYSKLLKEMEEEDAQEDQNKDAQNECGGEGCDLVDQLDDGNESPAAPAVDTAAAPSTPFQQDTDFAGGEYEADPFEEDADFAELRNNAGINDGKLSNLGDDLGPNHDANKPADDSSDEDIISVVAGETLDKGDQLNTGNNAQGKIQDGDTINPADAVVNGDDRDAAADDYGKAKHEASILDLVAFGEEGLADSDEEDALMSDAEDDTAQSPFSTDDLNEDEDDDIMSAVMGGR